MKDFFNYNDYRELIRYLVKLKPNNGYGQLKLISDHLNLNPASLSQILQGARELSEDQTYNLASYFSLSGDQLSYLLFLVLRERATIPELKKIYDQKIDQIRNSKDTLAVRVSDETKLSDEEKGLYYSTWVFSAVRNLLAVKKDFSSEELAQRLEIKEDLVTFVLKQLTKMNLIKNEGTSWTVLKKTTYLPPDSIFAIRHIQNWRNYSIHRVLKKEHLDLFFSSTISLSQKDWMNLREKFILEIENMYKNIEESPSEELVCLNIDLFRL